jgi:hypothetical protein
MFARHFAVFSFLICTSSLPAQTLLAERVEVGDCYQISLDMNLTGEIRFRKEATPITVKLAAKAAHAYVERAMAVENNMIQRSARVYETAKVTIDRGSDRSECTLRPSRKLVVAQRYKDQALSYSTTGALYRNELELLSGHFDTLSLSGIVNGKEVKVGDSWKLGNLVAQSLSGLEGMTEQKLEAKFDKLSEETAIITITGSVAGVEQGALVRSKIEASCSFDTKTKSLTKVVWQQKSDRDQGPVSPASTMDVRITLERKKIAQPESLCDVALVSVPDGFTPPGPMLNVEYRDPKERFALVHPRDWHLTAATNEHTVLRLVDRGDYVAQVTVTPWAKAKKGEHMMPEEFKKAMAETSGWRPNKELQAGEITAEGKYIYRLSVLGHLDGTEVLQNFYLVTAPTGEQVVLTFTLAPKAADKLGARDLTIAASIEVPAVVEKK